MEQHKYRPDGYGACRDCGYGATGLGQHGHQCIGKVLRSEDGRTGSCYECGRTVTWGDAPARIGDGTRAGGGVAGRPRTA